MIGLRQTTHGWPTWPNKHHTGVNSTNTFIPKAKLDSSYSFDVLTKRTSHLTEHTSQLNWQLHSTNKGDYHTSKFKPEPHYQYKTTIHEEVGLTILRSRFLLVTGPLLETGIGITKGSKIGTRNQTFGVVVLVLDVDVLLLRLVVRILETVVLHVRI